MKLLPEKIISEACHSSEEFYSHHTDNIYIACYHENKQPKSILETELIRQTAQLIDMGKMGISADILSKPGGLDENEKKIVQDHINISVQMLKLFNQDTFDIARNMILEHHERWDGSGYPDGKKGDEISLEGRIAAIADVFGALSSPRCYRQAWPLDKVFSSLFDNAGSLFDPDMVVLLSEHKDEIAGLYS